MTVSAPTYSELPTRLVITDSQKQQYQDQGFFVLENIIPPAHLEAMRGACQQEMDKKDAEMESLGVDKLGINHKGSRYFLPFLSQENAGVRRFIFSDLMADICRATVGPDAFLFLDQYVVKAAEKGMSFSWHQDEGYIPYPNPPYVGCWCALDDVSEANGTVYNLPYAEAGTRSKITHVKDEVTNDMVGYFGDAPGVPVIAPAGSIAVFSSTCFHRSGFNRTDKMRRAYLVQYSQAPITTDDGTGVRHLAEPFLQDGRNVARL